MIHHLHEVVRAEPGGRVFEEFVVESLDVEVADAEDEGRGEVGWGEGDDVDNFGW